MRLLIDLVENDEFDESKTLIESKLSDIVTSIFNQKAQSFVFEAAAAPKASEEDPQGTIEDPLLQPSSIVSKEYFFKRFQYGDHEILMKKVGMGQNAPTVTYIDGERYEVFTTAKQAEKETIRFIKDGSFEKMMAKKDADKKAKEDEEEKKANAEKQAEQDKVDADKQAEQDKIDAEEQKKKEQEDNHEKITESFHTIVTSDRPNIITLNSGEEKIVTVSEAHDALEILKLLNNENGIKFLKRLSDSVTSYQDTMDFFLDKIRKGIY